MEIAPRPSPNASAPRSRWLTPFVVSLFFAWGFATVLVDTLIPKLKAVFSLNYAEVMLTQFAFFLAYLAMSVPAGLVLSRIGYLRAVVAGLLVMAAGCLMFFPTIFTLGIEDQGADTPEASGLMCMAIVGGAVIPLVTGALADRFGLHLALLAPAACYLWIALYGRIASRAAGSGARMTVGRAPANP